jgi:DNA-binding MarR family transcriptional regulator
MSSTHSGARVPRARSPVPRVGIGPRLRFALVELRSRIYAGVVQAGFDDVRPTHVTLFRWPGPDGRRPTQVAEDTQLSKQRVRDLLRDLERFGYLRLEPDAVDGRARIIRLTARGRRLHRKTLEIQSILEREWSAQVGRRRFRMLMETLGQIARVSGEGGA